MNVDKVYTPDSDSPPISTVPAPAARPEMVEHRISGLPPSDSRAGSESVNGRGSESLGLLIEDSTSSSGRAGWLSPLHIAAQKGHDRIARVLLQHSIDCNEKDSDGLTPLIHATIGGFEDVVNSLLSHGARIGNVDGQRRSAFHWAVVYRREAVLKVLLNHCAGERTLIDGYDNDGRTPLHTAVDMGFEAGVQVLLQFGANVHYRARKS